MSPCYGLAPGTQGAVGQRIKSVWLKEHLFDNSVSEQLCEAWWY